MDTKTINEAVEQLHAAIHSAIGQHKAHGMETAYLEYSFKSITTLRKAAKATSKKLEAQYSLGYTKGKITGIRVAKGMTP